ncbi:MAG: anaerobic carbon-monoxide dehydrogenase catalytic subunit, partial [Bacillota bacterium]|nr:anaerobic carbon-monoxide dehydrogenase catalytic subunit [Bacillota bacterium]
AKDVALKALEDFQKQYGVLNWLKLKGNAKSIEKWQELGILPINAHAEIATAINRQAMGCDADPENLILGILRMALVEGFSGLHLATDLQDVLFGTPGIVKADYRLGTIKKDYVNIAVHGHIPMLSEKVVEWAERLKGEAVAAGAKGINLVGVCCTGNEILMRKGVSVATNFASQELPIVTGAIDVMIVDAQCIMPSLPKVAECYHTEIITTLPYVKISGATHIDFSPEKADEAGAAIIKKAINKFTERDQTKVQIPDDIVEAYAGFSVKEIVRLLSKLDNKEPLKPLVTAIASGDILGVAAIVGCTNPKLKQDWYNLEVAKYLLKNNVLVVATGCSAHSLAKFSLMSPKGVEYCGDRLRNVLETLGRAHGLDALPPALHMGSCVDNSRVDDLLVAVANYLDVSVSQLPAVGSCPETHSPKAISIGAYFLAQGVDVHVGIAPPISGSPIIGGALLGDKANTPLSTDALFGGKLIHELDPHKAGQLMVERIKQKRVALGLKA